MLIKDGHSKTNYYNTYNFLESWFKKKYDCYKDYDTQKTYIKHDGYFKEIELPEIVLLLKSVYGKIISYQNIQKIRNEAITEPITSDYNLIQFTNGVLNTNTEEFHKNMKLNNRIPKLYIDYDYIFDAETEFKETNLYKELSNTLRISNLDKEIEEKIEQFKMDNDFRTNYKNKFKNNELRFFMAVGNTAMATNESERFIILRGAAGSGKSTILAILSRIFNCVNLSIQSISSGERFALVPAVRKDIVIDDDVSTAQIKDIGRFNTFVTQTGLYVEFKGLNNGINMKGEINPVLWGAANQLPSVFNKGGFDRRVCLILCMNIRKYNDRNKDHINRIERGERDSEIALMLCYAIQTFFKHRKEPFLTREEQEAFLDEWEINSFPTKVISKELYMDTLDLEDIIEDINLSGDISDYLTDVQKRKIKNNVFNIDLEYVDGKHEVIIKIADLYDETNEYKEEVHIPSIISRDEAKKEIRRQFKIYKKLGKIEEETKDPSNKQIQAGMNSLGFEDDRIYNSDINKRERFFIDCCRRKDLEKIMNRIIELVLI